MKVYLAASFAYEDRKKTEERKAEIESVVDRINKQRNFNFYLPHQLKIPNAWDISLEEWGRQVFEHDIKALDEADLVIFVSYGKENNSGSVWEVGYAHAKGKKILCIKMTNDTESLMISNSVDTIMMKEEIENYDWNELKSYKTKLEKLS